MPLKRSPEFRALRPRLVGEAPHPVFDSWLDDGFHFFVFLLALEGDGHDDRAEESAVAVFAMHPEKTDPVSAVTIIPTANGRQAEITNLIAPGGSYKVQLRPEPAEGDS